MVTCSINRHPGQPLHDNISEKCVHNRHGSLLPAMSRNNDPLLHRLPVELVSEIFEHTLPFPPCSKVFESDFCEKRHIEAVNILGHVSKNWRNIARSTPGLWTIISFDLRRTSDKACWSLMVRQWLHLSKALPLFLRLHQSNHQFKDQLFVAAKLIPLIAIHAHRYQVLELCNLSQPVVDLLSLRLSVYRLDRLDHLKLSLLNNRPDKSRAFQLNASPCLLTAQQCSLPTLSIRWDRLSHFVSTKDEDLSVQEFIFLLQNAPSLRYCLIPRIVFTKVQATTVVHHASLETLLIGYCQWEMWRFFTAPSLKTLRVDCAPDDPGWVSMREFISRSGCSITDLSFYTTGRAYLNHAEWPKELSDALRDIPCLEKLSIHGDGLRESLMTSLANSITAASDGPAFLPNLKSLTMTYLSVARSFNWSGVVDFVKAMTSRPEQSLQLVQVHFTRALLYGEVLEIDKDAFKAVMEVVRELGFRILAADGSNMVERFCRDFDL